MITYFTLAIVGGLWAPVSTFPDSLATIGRCSPRTGSRTSDTRWPQAGCPTCADVAILAIYTVVIGVLVVWRYRTDQGRVRA